MVVILDPRVATKRYGMRFLKSLPEAGWSLYEVFQDAPELFRCLSCRIRR